MIALGIMAAICVALGIRDEIAEQRRLEDMARVTREKQHGVER